VHGGAPDDDAPGRRRRGLIIAGVVLAVGVPITGWTWLSERNVDREAAAVAQDLRTRSRFVDDVAELAADELTSAWGDDGRERSPLAAALGNQDRFAGALFGGEAISAAYEVRWGFASRCVLLRLSDDDVRTEVRDSSRCEPLAL
jgi:hypothetical protein